MAGSFSEDVGAWRFEGLLWALSETAAPQRKGPLRRWDVVAGEGRDAGREGGFRPRAGPTPPVARPGPQGGSKEQAPSGPDYRSAAFS